MLQAKKIYITDRSSGYSYVFNSITLLRKISGLSYHRLMEHITGERFSESFEIGYFNQEVAKKLIVRAHPKFDETFFYRMVLKGDSRFKVPAVKKEDIENCTDDEAERLKSSNVFMSSFYPETIKTLNVFTGERENIKALEICSKHNLSLFDLFELPKNEKYFVVLGKYLLEPQETFIYKDELLSGKYTRYLKYLGPLKVFHYVKDDGTKEAFLSIDDFLDYIGSKGEYRILHKAYFSKVFCGETEAECEGGMLYRKN